MTARPCRAGSSPPWRSCGGGRLHAAGADLVVPEMLPKLRVVKADPDDDLFLATALASGAQVLVSGDRRHLRKMPK